MYSELLVLFMDVMIVELIKVDISTGDMKSIAQMEK